MPKTGVVLMGNLYLFHAEKGSKLLQMYLKLREKGGGGTWGRSCGYAFE